MTNFKRIIIFSIIILLLMPLFSFGEEIDQEPKKILSIWQEISHWIKENILVRVGDWTKSEYQKRKEYFRQNLEQEKQEIKEEVRTEVPKVGQSLWQKFKNLIIKKFFIDYATIKY